MGPARIYPWRKMHRSRAPSIALGTFFVAQFSAGYITNMSGFDLRQTQWCKARSDRGSGYRAHYGFVQTARRIVIDIRPEYL
jgi:hypothetical protein